MLCLLYKVFVSYRRLLAHTPDVLPVGDAPAQPLGVGVLEHLKVGVGVVHVVYTARPVGGGRHLQVMCHPPLNLNSCDRKPYSSPSNVFVFHPRDRYSSCTLWAFFCPFRINFKFYR
jgi:hypothetical protein